MVPNRLSKPHLHLDPDEFELEISRIATTVSDDCTALVDVARAALDSVEETFDDESDKQLPARAVRL